MSANIVADFFHLLRSTVFLVTVLSSVSTHGSGAVTNSSNGKLLLRVGFEGESIKECALLRIGEAQGGLKLDSLTNSGASNSNALRLAVTKTGGRCGVILTQSIQAEANQWYDLTFRARTEKRENDRGYGLTVSLESRDGKQLCARTTIPEVGGDWRDYTVALHSRLAHAAAILTITLSEPGAIWFDEIELRQRQTGREKQTP